MVTRRTVMAGGVAMIAAGIGRGALAAASATVSAPAGRFAGLTAGGIRMFTGIPFAKPPVGPLRFAPPVAADPLPGVFDATRPAALPVQMQGAEFLTGTEDCLQLNIWAPDGPGPYPVLVWIFGGGNVGGGIARPMYDGRAFARDGVICVCINYRLGALGFLELGDIVGERGTANNAIRDQLLALRWVRDNIAAFGGDPARVTLAGQSAGAGDATILLTLPEAAGLFHRAVLASGGGGGVGTVATADAYAHAFVDKLGGRARLRSATAVDLMAAQNGVRAFAPIGIRPLLDGKFITATPIDRLRAGAARQLPIMTGWTRDEYLNFQSLDAIGAIDMTKRPLGHFGPDRRSGLLDAYRHAFPALSKAEINLKILGADLIKAPTQQILDAQAAAGAPVHAYELAYGVAGSPYGGRCVHGADVPLIFERLATSFATGYGYSSADQPAAGRLHAAWVSFIKGEPLSVATSAWPTYDAKTRSTMVLDQDPHMAHDPDRTERLIWDAFAR